MSPFAYPAKFEREPDGRVTVTLVDFPNSRTDGKDLQEAIEEASDLLGSVIAQYLADKAALPNPSASKRGQRMIAVPLWIAGKLALHLAMRERRINNCELARRLGVRETVVRRMLDPDHATKSEKLQAALTALGKRLVVRLENAA